MSRAQRQPSQTKFTKFPNPNFRLWTRKKKNMTSARQEFNKILLQNEKKTK
jgi:hypothetical protein